jgi:hypothetical protein
MADGRWQIAGGIRIKITIRITIRIFMGDLENGTFATKIKKSAGCLFKEVSVVVRVAAF